MADEKTSLLSSSNKEEKGTARRRSLFGSFNRFGGEYKLSDHIIYVMYFRIVFLARLFTNYSAA